MRWRIFLSIMLLALSGAGLAQDWRVPVTAAAEPGAAEIRTWLRAALVWGAGTVTAAAVPDEAVAKVQPVAWLGLEAEGPVSYARFDGEVLAQLLSEQGIACCATGSVRVRVELPPEELERVQAAAAAEGLALVLNPMDFLDAVTIELAPNGKQLIVRSESPSRKIVLAMPDRPTALDRLPRVAAEVQYWRRWWPELGEAKLLRVRKLERFSDLAAAQLVLRRTPGLRAVRSLAAQGDSHWFRLEAAVAWEPPLPAGLRMLEGGQGVPDWLKPAVPLRQAIWAPEVPATAPAGW